MCAARLITFDIRLPFHSLKAKEIAFRSVSLIGEHRHVAS
jgi:hypothetical protein